MRRVFAESSSGRGRKEAGIADPRLVAAVRNGNRAIVRQFLDDGVSPFDTNDEGVSLLELAKIRGDIPLFMLLKDFSVNSARCDSVSADNGSISEAVVKF